METKIDISYGVVPIRKEESRWLVLLVHQISYRGDDFWIFPKGHAEVGETPVRAALRELKEETGVEAVQLDSTEPIAISYSFTHEHTRIHKTVSYYVGRCEDADVVITQPHEIKEIRWCDFVEARELLSHQNSRDVLTEVEKRLGV